MNTPTPGPTNTATPTELQRLMDIGIAPEDTVPIAELQAEFPHLQILEALGHSGMGLVYKALETQIHRPVVLKLLPLARDADPGYLTRFRNEAILLASIRHPSIVTIYSYGATAAGRPWILMELIEGCTLATRLRQKETAPSDFTHTLSAEKTIATRTKPQSREEDAIAKDKQPFSPDGDILNKSLCASASLREPSPPAARQNTAHPLPVREALRIAIELCDALHAIHEKGIIHRDIKPANIMLPLGEKARLIDFGIALNINPANPSRLTTAGSAIGTQGYMAPEQRLGEPINHRADLYALGIVLLEMLTGNPPGSTGSSPATHDPLPAGLTAIITRATAHLPSARHQTAAELRAELQAILDKTPSPTSQTDGHAASGNSGAREKAAFWANVFLALLIGVLILLLASIPAYFAKKERAARKLPAPTHPIISPDGGAYTAHAASSSEPESGGPAALFDEAPALGRQISTSPHSPKHDYAGLGPGPHYCTFSLPRPHTIHTLLYAQRDYLDRHDPRHDKAAAIHLWAIADPALPPSDPARPPDRIIPITHRSDDTFLEYPIGSPLTGQHFLIAIIPPADTPTRDPYGNHPGAAELRLGGYPE